MKSSLLALLQHIKLFYTFRHDGRGLPKNKSLGFKGFVLLCFGISVLSQCAVIALSPASFEHMLTSEKVASVLILYIPGLCCYALQRTENIFSVCLLYLGFSLSGLLGVVLMPAIGTTGAWLSLMLVCWCIGSYLWFSPKLPASKASSVEHASKLIR